MSTRGVPAPAADARPVLIYDGDCDFCRYWADYWHALTGERMRYAPYQRVAQDYPRISVDDFRAAVQYVGADGRVARAAEASFLTLSHAPHNAIWIRLYRRLPGFAWASERAYASIAAHRPLAFRITRALWGPSPTPPRHQRTIGLFLRVLALIYLAAFVSFGVQILGLVGAHGVLPLAPYLAELHALLGPAAWLHAPTLFWLDASDAALQLACAAGAALSLLLAFGVAPRVCLALLAVLYLSLFYAGQVFMEFQWDLLLIEIGWLAIALQSGSRLALWLGRWLLFRVVFLSGVVKLASGDPSWANLTALQYHFETQPLPTPLAWYAHQLPDPLLAALAAVHFAIELGFVFLIFLPRRARFVAAGAIVALQLGIMASGNYGFFNLQVLALCLLLLDDAALARVPQWLARIARREPGRLAARAIGLYALVVMPVSTIQIYEAFARRAASGPAAAVKDFVAPLRAVNPYGVFAHMVTERLELVVEGSADGRTWREYAFKYKPGDPRQAPRWVIPHQPRLDWQLWFAALGNLESDPWVTRFMARLLENSPDVLALLAANPFPDRPPVQVRARLERYRFGAPAAHAQGIWWERNEIGLYAPPFDASQLEAGARPPESAPALIDSLIRRR